MVYMYIYIYMCVCVCVCVCVDLCLRYVIFLLLNEIKPVFKEMTHLKKGMYVVAEIINHH